MLNLPPEKDPSSIGNILVSMGLIKQEELEKLVIEFKKTEDQLLGEFLIKKSIITTENVELALIKQRAMRNERQTHAAVINAYELSEKVNQKLISTADGIISLSKSLTSKA